MTPARHRPQIALASELTAGAMIDDAFALVRRLPRMELWPAYAFVALLGALVAAVGWTEHLSDAGPGWGSPGLLRLLSVARIGLVAAEVLLGMALARSAWRLMRGSLDGGPSPAVILLGATLVVPAVLLVTFLPAWLLLSDELRRGTISLLPGEWLQDGQIILAGVASLAFAPLVQLAAFVVVVEGRDPLTAIGRSCRLAVLGGLKAHGVVAILFAVRLALSVGLAFLLIGAEGLDAESDPHGRRAAFGCAGLLLQGLLAPQTQLALMLAYLDARVRLEGLDVEQDGRQCGLLSSEEAA